MESQFQNLLKPYQIGGATIKNRFCMAPMGVMPIDPMGGFSEEGANYFIERARGGFGLIFTGAVMTDIEVDPFSPLNGISPLYNPANFTKLSFLMNERIHAYGAKMFCQLSMGLGRNYPGLKAPSELPVFSDPSLKSQALTIEEIKKKINALIQAAAIVKAAGYDGIEVHAIHYGYLLDEFAMTITNQRTDEYGGSLENRLRAAKEIIQGIKQVCGSDYPVTMRLGLKSFIKGLGFGQSSLTGEDEAGRTLEEGLKIAQLLESYGYDALSVDVGIYESFYQAAPPMYMPKGHVLPLAAEAKKVVKIPILLSNRMNDPYMAEQAIAEGKIDAVVMGRASLADPYFPNKIETGKVETIRPCIACNQGCLGLAFTVGACSCAVNPAALRELTYGISKTTDPKKVVVIGGGVSGMEAARTAKMRGHEVSLYEAGDKLGGNLITGGAHSFKEDIRKLNEWYQRELQDLNIPVKLNTKVDAGMIPKMDADAAILALGSVPVIPNVPGIDKAISSVDALLGKKKIGKNVVVIGGGLVGCELALEYAMEGKNVTIIEMLDSILSAGLPVPLQNKMMLTDLLPHYKVEIRTGCKLTAINDKGAIIASMEDGQKSEEIAADSVVIAIGYKSVPSEIQDLYGNGIKIYKIGDCNRVGNVMTSIWDAYEVARSI